MVCAGDDFDSLRLKWKDQLTGGTNYNLSNALVKSRLQSITNSAQSYWNSMDKSPTRTYLWSDLTSTTVSAQIVTAYSRLRAMALGYASYGTTMRGNAALAADIQGGLSWMYANRYNESKVQYDNWFHWEIGAPLQITDLAVLMYEALGMTGLSNSLNTVDWFTPSPTNHGLPGTFTGANLADRIRIVGVRGVVVKDSAKLIAAREALSNLFPYVTSGDGYYLDGSFVQHVNHPYTGSYGYVLLGDVAALLPWLQGSPWECVDPARTNVLRWIYDSYEPLLYRGAMMDMSRGRAISRSGSADHIIGHTVMQHILTLSEYGSSADRARIRSMVKYLAQSDTYRNFTNNAPLPLLTKALQLMTDSGTPPRGELLGHWTFAGMDQAVHLRPGWGFALSMSSKRIANYEYMNGENLKGWFTGDGMTYLYNSDLSQFSDYFWPTIDPYRLPGTTVDTTTRADGSGSSYTSANRWTGGVTLQHYGSAGMDLDAYGSTLAAKKSWFMFDDEVVCLGAGISCSSAATVQTTVENRKLSSSNTNTFTLDGTVMSSSLGWSNYASSAGWCALGGAGGYYFPSRAGVKMIRQARTGSWSLLNTGGSTTTATRNYLTLWFDHGAKPANASYSYVLLPNFSSSQVSAYAAAPEIVIIENSTDVQAVRETGLGVVAANFWNSGTRTADLITCSGAAAVITTEDAAGLWVAVSDPTQINTGTIEVELDRGGTALVFADPGITVSQLSPTIRFSVDVAGAGGRSFLARFGTPGLPPGMSVFQNRLVNEDTATGPIAFTVWDDTTPAENLELSVRSSNDMLLPASSFALSGTGSNRFLSILPATNQFGIATVYVKASDGLAATTNTFQLTVSPMNDAPWAGPVADRMVNPGVVISFSVPAGDVEAPPQSINFRLLSAPVGAAVGWSDGVFAWRPAIAQAGSSNFVCIQVTDNGVPSLSATQSFSVFVNPAQVPVFGTAASSNGVFGVVISGQAGPDYEVYASSDLTNWTSVFTTNPAAMPFLFEDTGASNTPRRFYRLRLGP